MKTELAYYDLLPRVVPCGRTVPLVVRPRDRHARFEDGKAVHVHVHIVQSVHILDSGEIGAAHGVQALTLASHGSHGA